jgi:hypothetical protein
MVRHCTIAPLLYNGSNFGANSGPVCARRKGSGRGGALSDVSHFTKGGRDEKGRAKAGVACGRNQTD